MRPFRDLPQTWVKPRKSNVVPLVPGDCEQNTQLTQSIMGTDRTGGEADAGCAQLRGFTGNVSSREY